ncbi:sure-like protein [Collybia nuda]|uniref:Sure-like protein n=1 Tax=Collybia nuda TaxID=64659 RepID=A0A9P5Y4H9_9AGAR|nr:sure-like protein [Collybia nuda]
MRFSLISLYLHILIFSQAASATSVLPNLKVVLTNDDGWAVAQIRSEYNALHEAGFNASPLRSLSFTCVLMSAPAVNKSGTGNSTAVPSVLTTPCEFDTCPVGSPAVGFNATDRNLNYVNAFPVDAVTYGIQALAPKLFQSPPDLVISGSNVGNNLGSVITGSATVRAAAAGSLLGFPSIAFSGATAAQISYTTLESDPTSKFSLAAATYNNLTLTFLQKYLSNLENPILPPGVTINVNYPGTENCPTASSISWIFTRIAAPSEGTRDVESCGKTQLTDELTTIRLGCYATISVFNATTIQDVSADKQEFVLKKLQGLLSCLP